MFFILSKTLSYLTMPLVIIVAFLIASCFIRKPRLKKWLFGLGLGLLLFCGNDFITNEVITAWELPPVAYNKMSTKYEYGILLTGVTRLEAEPRDRVHFSRGADRATHSVQLYKLGIIKKILVSGGSGRLDGSGPKEADELATALIMMGVDSTDIVLENESRNTHESAENVRKMLDGKVTSSQCLLVTSGYHMRRSVACFEKANWKTDYFSTNILSHERKFSFDALFIPKPEAIEIWHALVREWVGMIAYRIAGYI